MPFKLPNFSNPLPRFGGQLRDYRTLRGISIEQLAEVAEVTPNALREMEAGRRAAPSKQIARALADTLRLSKEEREVFLDAAEFESGVVGHFLGTRPEQPARPPLTAAILVFLIADIRGYTHFTLEEGDDAAAKLTTRFAELGHAAVEQWDGQLIEIRGDEILAVFASARQAVRAAHELQTRYVEEAANHPEWPVGIGVGLDVGEAAQVDDGYRGAALNRAARLCALAAPGEVLVSAGMVYLAPRVEGIVFEARGQAQLKGFDGPTPILLAAASQVIEMAPSEPDEPSDV